MYPRPAPREPSCNAIRAPRAPRAPPPPPRVRPLLKPWQAKGDHISFVIGPFRPRLGPPPTTSDLEPRGWSLLPGALESVEPATARRGELRRRVANAAGPRPRHLSETSRRRARLGWPQPRRAYRAELAPCALASWGFCTSPPIRAACVCTRARAPSFSALPPLPPPPPLSTLVIGTDRNSESF